MRYMGPDEPLVSVIIPTYQRETYLDGAIRTAFNQTYENIEVIVVNDDADHEPTVAITDKHKDDDKFIVRHNQNRRGVSESRNQAASLASGKYLCILDDDDRWVEKKVEKQVELFESLTSDYGLVYTGGKSVVHGEVTRISQPGNHRRGDVWPEILTGWDLSPHSSHMIRASAFDTVGGFRSDLQHGEDWEFAIRLAKKYKFEAVDEPLTIRRTHSENISENRDHIRQQKDILAHHSEHIFEKEHIYHRFFANWFQTIGRWSMEDGEWKKGVRYSTLAVAHNPSVERFLIMLAALGGPRFYAFCQFLRNI